MKHLFSFLIGAALLLSMVACGSTSTEKMGDTMTLEQIIETILADVTDLPAVNNVVPDASNYQYYAFIDPVEGAETFVSESMINAVPHSSVLIRVPEGTEVETVAQELREKANPNKWICVSAEKTIIKVHGRTILLVLSYTDTADQIASNFDKLWK